MKLKYSFYLFIGVWLAFLMLFRLFGISLRGSSEWHYAFWGATTIGVCLVIAHHIE